CTPRHRRRPPRGAGCGWCGATWRRWTATSSPTGAARARRWRSAATWASPRASPRWWRCRAARWSGRTTGSRRRCRAWPRAVRRRSRPRWWRWSTASCPATAAGAGLAHANGQVRGEGWGRFDTVPARGGLTLTGSFSAGTVRPRDTVEPVVAVSIPEVPEVQMPAYRIDVYPLRAAANYVFEYVGNRIQVQVSQVAGIPDGTYVLGERQDGRKDWLCRAGDLRNGVCQRPVAT